MKKHIRFLKDMHACDEAVQFADDFRSLKSAWNACERGDWMLWLIRRTMNKDDESQLRVLTLAKAICAKLVLHLMLDERSKNAVDVAERFGLGQASRMELDAAAATAYAAAANAAYTAAAADAANAANAAYAAAAADAANAANAAAAAYAANAANAAAAARNYILKRAADEIRKVARCPEVK
jgi:hypothetical protein